MDKKKFYERSDLYTVLASIKQQLALPIAPQSTCLSSYLLCIEPQSAFGQQLLAGGEGDTVGGAGGGPG